MLQLKEKAGTICQIKKQVAVELTEAKLRYKIDFSFIEMTMPGNWQDNIAYAEAKGCSTDRWLIAEKLWPYYGPSRLYIYKGDWRDPRLVEIIETRR